MKAAMTAAVTLVKVVLAGEHGHAVFIIIKICSLNQFLAHLSVFLKSHLSLSAGACLVKNKYNVCVGFLLCLNPHNVS